MTSSGAATGRARGGLAGKRKAILAGAFAVFARDGYTRASIDAIAAEAGVSTRTIYNHFDGKAQLFEVVIQASATEVADAQVADIERHLGEVTDLEADLVKLGRALATPMTGHADHFALVRQIHADAGHIPQAALDAWQEAGPQRVRRALADRLRELAERGMLRGGEPERAAIHFMLLVTGAVPFHHGVRGPRKAEITEIVTSGVRAFLYGYQA